MNFKPLIGLTRFPKCIDNIIFEFLNSKKILIHSEFAFKSEIIYKQVPSHYLLHTLYFARTVLKEVQKHGDDWVLAHERGDFKKYREPHNPQNWDFNRISSF